jgi:glycosyltransferase involved in cell wall biosynthesis
MNFQHDVMFLIRSLEIGGAERQVALLAKSLAVRGARVAVVTFYPGGLLQEELAESPVRVVNIGKAGRWDLLRSGIQLVRTIRKLRPRALYSFMPSANIAAAVLRPWHKVETLAWGIRASDMSTSHTDLFLRGVSRLEVALSGIPEVIISNSISGRDAHIKRGFSPKQFKVIPNAINSDRFKFDAEKRHALRTKLSLADDTPLIGMIARFDPMKDYETFLRGAAVLRERGFSGRFICLGSGNEKLFQEFKTKAIKLGLSEHLHWLAPTADPVEIYSALDVFVLTSGYGEGFSNVIGEAMACGLPCVVTQVGDGPQIVTQEDYIVPVGNPRALADGIANAASSVGIDRIHNLRRDKIMSNYGIDQLVTETLKALRISSR